MCRACGEAGLAAESFYFFHCGHAFHQRCVISYEHRSCPQHRRGWLPERKRERARRLNDELRDGRLLLQEEAEVDYHAAEERRARLADAKRELDEIFGADCPLRGAAVESCSSLPNLPAAGKKPPAVGGEGALCGDSMIREVGLEFVAPDEPEVQSWQL